MNFMCQVFILYEGKEIGYFATIYFILMNTYPRFPLFLLYLQVHTGGHFLHEDVSVMIMFFSKMVFPIVHEYRSSHITIRLSVGLLIQDKNKCFNDIRLSTPAQIYVTKCFPS